PMMMNGNMNNGQLIGYATMVIALSTIFIGTKTYRDRILGGTIKFGRAFLVGLYISLVASFLYATGWEVFLASQEMSGTDFMEFYVQCQVDQLEKSGASAEKIARVKAQADAGYNWYNSMPLRFLFTMLAESLPVGVIVSLISAAILKRKTPKTLGA
ncbi:MAG: DUF4199 domain-containing protein, partial [Taibaiella sp.]|nr:DUF4199 domain-containing protein [Taibaiella sp.]